MNKGVDTAVEPCCPNCKSTAGFSGDMTETHSMSAPWGETLESVDSGQNVKWGWMYCNDCGNRYSLVKLVALGLAVAPESMGAR